MFKKTRKVTIAVSDKCSLTYLNDAVVRAIGKNPEKVSCDYSKLVVSRDIYNSFKAYIKSLGWDQSAAAEVWSEFGLSISESLTGGEVEIRTMNSKLPIGKAVFFVLWAAVVYTLTQHFDYYCENDPLAVTNTLAIIFRMLGAVILEFIGLVCLVRCRRRIAHYTNKYGNLKQRSDYL